MHWVFRTVLAMSVVACTGGRAEPALGSASPAPLPLPTAADAGPRSAMHEHFLFKGDPAGRDDAFVRVRRVMTKYEAAPRRDMRMPSMADLDRYLKDHYVQVTPEQATLHVVTHPATNPSWDLSFDIGADDALSNMVLGEDAPPPRR